MTAPNVSWRPGRAATPRAVSAADGPRMNASGPAEVVSRRRSGRDAFERRGIESSRRCRTSRLAARRARAGCTRRCGGRAAVRRAVRSTSRPKACSCRGCARRGPTRPASWCSLGCQRVQHREHGRCADAGADQHDRPGRRRAARSFRVGRRRRSDRRPSRARAGSGWRAVFELDADPIAALVREVRERVAADHRGLIGSRLQADGEVLAWLRGSRSRRAVGGRRAGTT